MKLIVKTLEGLEESLRLELLDLGADNAESLKRAVLCYADLPILYRINVLSRLALKVLVFVDEFEVNSEKDFYDHLYNFEWEKYLTKDSTIAVDSVVNSETFKHANYMALKCKDAIVDRMRSLTNERPNVDVDNPDLRVNIHIRNRTVTLSLDSTGRSLHMRGYRIGQGQAPINEVLAAGILSLANWDKTSTLIDPMCGSATFLCEAAFMALGISPQKNEREYAFMKWENFDKELWAKIKANAYEIKSTLTQDIIKGYDKDESIVEIAQKNIDHVGLTAYITLGVEDFFFQEGTENATIVMNPPYDGRIKENEVVQFYKYIGDKLKSSYSGCNAWIISGHIEALKNLGLRPSRRIPLINGSIPAVLAKFELYRGSKKTKFNNQNPDDEV